MRISANSFTASDRVCATPEEEVTVSYHIDIPCIFTDKAFFTVAVNKAYDVNLSRGYLSHKVFRRLAPPHTPAVGGIAGATGRAHFVHSCAREWIGPDGFRRTLLSRSESRASDRVGQGGTGTASAGGPAVTGYSSTIGTGSRTLSQSGRVLGGTANRCLSVSRPWIARGSEDRRYLPTEKVVVRSGPAAQTLRFDCRSAPPCTTARKDSSGKARSPDRTLGGPREPAPASSCEL